MRTRLLLIGIDGLRAEVVDGATAPTLSELLRGRAGMTMAVPTMSGPGWSTLLTGVPPEVHGVTGNDFADHRLLDAPDLLSRLAEADPDARTLVAASWPPLVEAPGPVLRARAGDQARGRHVLLADDGEAHGYRGADERLTAAAAAAIADDGLDAAFVYLGEVDEAGHRSGALSDDYRAAVGRVDAHVAALLAAVRARAAAGEAWLVVVTTDHGHLDGGGHGGPEPEVTESFAAVRAFGADAPVWPVRLAPHDLAPRLLELLRD